MVLISLFAPNIVGPGWTDLLIVSGAYLLATSLLELFRRVSGGRGLLLVASMLLIDGVYLAWVTYATGGPDSPLRALVYLHLIAVTLLASYRTGLKIALWHSLMFFVAFYAQLADIIPPLIPIEGTPEQAAAAFNHDAVMDVMAFWVVALGTAAFSALNERELRRGKTDLQSLATMAADLETINQPDEVAQELLDRIGQAFGFKRGVVLGAQKGDLEVMACIGNIADDDFSFSRDSVIQKAWANHSPVAVKALSPESDEMLNRLMPDGRNVIVVPMFADSRPIGVLAVEQPHVRAGIERRIVSMLEQFTAYASLALRNAWLMGEVWKMAETDALTGIANRRVFERTLQREVMRAKRADEPVSLVMMDIDHFKKLNDAYGHPEGDKVLQMVAELLSTSARSFDTPARYGGEEFAVILPTCTAEESIFIADRLRQLVEQIEFKTGITVSAGVATFPVHAANATELLGAADEALYESKAGGRNRVSRSRRAAALEALSALAAEDDHTDDLGNYRALAQAFSSKMKDLETRPAEGSSLQRPLKRGSLFSTQAVTASRVSSLANISD